jgi:hypothetical protein
MRHPIRNITLAVLVLLCVVFFFACRTPTPPPTSQFTNDWTGLFLAVTKSFGKRTYYIGSDERWTYFQTKGEELFTPTYRKVEATRMSLPRTFPFAQGTPYLIQLTNFVGYEKQ